MNDAANPATLESLGALRLEDRQHESILRLDHHFELDRRDFVKLLGGGVLICLCVKPSLGQESGSRQRDSEDDLPQAIDAWLHIGEDGNITVYTGKVEIGQNIRTSLTQQVAEELRVPMSSIRMVMGDTDLTPFDMGTFGSRTTPTMGPRLRRVAVSAREMLTEMAAAQLGVDKSALVASDGKITDRKSNRSLAYRELTRGKQLTKVMSGDSPLTVATEWKIAGTSPAKVNGRDFVTGEHKYPSDQVLPGMLYGKVLRPAAFKAKLVSLDASAAKKLAGVTVVRDGEFIGVAAPDTYSASRALEALKARWDAPSQPTDAELFHYLRTHPGEDDHWGGSPHQSGSLEQGYASAAKTLKQTYTVAYIAHTPMEPRAAVAEWKEGKLTVWTGTQRPFAVRDELAEAFHIPKSKVRVIVPDTGDGFGGKHTGETAVEAARLARAAGKPVKVLWTRQEEFTWAYFRPAGVMDVKAAIQDDGRLVAWEFDNYNSGPSGITTPYEVANQRIQFHSSDSPLRQGSYRGLAATANHFVRESFMDELAHAAGLDPLEFRLKNLTDPRLRAVFQAAADKFGLEGCETIAHSRLRHGWRNREGRVRCLFCGGRNPPEGQIGQNPAGRRSL